MHGTGAAAAGPHDASSSTGGWAQSWLGGPLPSGASGGAAWGLGGWGGDGSGSGSVLAALLASPAAADLVLWVLLRVHAKLLATPVYRRVMWLLEQQHAEVLSELKALDAHVTRQQAQEVGLLDKCHERDGCLQKMVLSWVLLRGFHDL